MCNFRLVGDFYVVRQSITNLCQSGPIWDLTGTVQIVGSAMQNQYAIASTISCPSQIHQYDANPINHKTNNPMSIVANVTIPVQDQSNLKFRTYLSPTVWSIRKDNQKRRTTKGEGHPKGGGQPMEKDNQNKVNSSFFQQKSTDWKGRAALKNLSTFFSKRGGHTKVGGQQKS